MSGENLLDAIPEPDTIRKQLSARLSEVAALRQMLKLAERAARAREHQREAERMEAANA